MQRIDAGKEESRRGRGAATGEEGSALGRSRGPSGPRDSGRGSWAAPAAWRLALLLAGLALAACGGSAPPPKEPEAPPPPPPHKSRLSVSTELGQIDAAATDATFKRIQGDVMGCYRDGQRRVEYLGGDVKIFLRVAQDGSVKWGYLTSSTLGDRSAERCILDVASRASWPKPDGGEAEVQNSYGFDPPGDVRVPTDWSPEKVQQALTASSAAVSKCKAGVPGSFYVTAYVEPHGKTGHVAAVGIAPPNQDGEGKVDCLVDVLKKMKLPSPGSYAAKVSFTL